MTKRAGSSDTSFVVYDAVGDGIPLLALHGAYSARIEVRHFLEPIVRRRPVRRLYVDLPGHGDSRPSSGVETPDQVLDLLDLVLDAQASMSRFLVLGHSFGGHLARALAARHPDRVAGVAMICPALPGEQRVPEPTVVRDDHVSAVLESGERADFEGYFVVRTDQTLARFRRAVAPAAGTVDEKTLERAIDTGPHAADPDAVSINAPALVLAGRNDHWVGWERQQQLGERYPHSTVVVVADAGHALPHERPRLTAALISDWLDQAGVAADPGPGR